MGPCGPSHVHAPAGLIQTPSHWQQPELGGAAQGTGWHSPGLHLAGGFQCPVWLGTAALGELLPGGHVRGRMPRCHLPGSKLLLQPFSTIPPFLRTELSILWTNTGTGPSARPGSQGPLCPQPGGLWEQGVTRDPAWLLPARPPDPALAAGAVRRLWGRQGRRQGWAGRADSGACLHIAGISTPPDSATAAQGSPPCRRLGRGPLSLGAAGGQPEGFDAQYLL